VAHHFKRKESVSNAVRRLGRERIRDAVDCLQSKRRADAVHCARKDIKKVRAVLRLVRERLERKHSAKVRKRLRESAADLTAVRDAYITTKTMDDLLRRYAGRLAPAASRRVRSALRNHFNAELKRFTSEQTAKHVVQTLRRAADALRKMAVHGKEWSAIQPGLKRTYQRGQRVLRLVEQEPAPENFHEWRKRTKDLWYHVRLLRPVSPEQLDAIGHDLGRLGDYLGDDHDLVILSGHLNDQLAPAERARKVLAGMIDQRPRELRAAALHLGERFYAEDASAFCDRLAGYWRAWRRGKKRTASSAGSAR